MLIAVRAVRSPKTKDSLQVTVISSQFSYPCATRTLEGHEGGEKEVQRFTETRW